MKKLTKVSLIMAILSLVVLTGCMTLNKSTTPANLNVDIKAELKADIEVGEKIMGNSQAIIVLGIFKIGGDNKFADGVTYQGASGGEGMAMPISLPLLGSSTVDKLKAGAAYKAIKGSGADVIIFPNYEIEETNYLVFKKYNVSVNGLKGIVKSIK